MAKQKRDNDYYRQRLKKVRPDLYREVQNGRITVNKARQLAGLGATRTRLNELKHAWKQATARERAEFTHWAGLAPSPATVPPAAPATPATPSVFDSEGVMAPWARKRILDIMLRRALFPGDLARELGLNPLNASVMTAVRRGTRVRVPAVIAVVEAWLAKHAAL